MILKAKGLIRYTVVIYVSDPLQHLIFWDNSGLTKAVEGVYKEV